MRRRNVIQAVGAVSAAWPFAVQAQQLSTPVIGYLGVTNAEDEAIRVGAFRQGLGETGLRKAKTY